MPAAPFAPNWSSLSPRPSDDIEATVRCQLHHHLWYRMARSRPQSRTARVRHVYRPGPRRCAARAIVGPGGRGHGHHSTAPGDTRARQRLSPSGAGRQRSRHAGRTQRRPHGARAGRWLAGVRLRANRHSVRKGISAGGTTRGGSSTVQGAAYFSNASHLPRRALLSRGARAATAANPDAAAADHGWRPLAPHALVRGARGAHRQHFAAGPPLARAATTAVVRTEAGVGPLRRGLTVRFAAAARERFGRSEE